MCLAVPGRVTETYRENEMLMGRIDFSGVTRKVCLEFVADARPGDYVLVHVGFALSRIDAAEAARIFQALKEIRQLDDLEAPSG